MAETRDLSFKPVTNPSPKKLTGEQIEFYNENGYVGPFPIFDATGVEKNREYLDYLLSEINRLGDGRDSYAINCYQTLCAGIWDLCVHPEILDYVEDIVGPNSIAWASHYFCKMPGDGKAVPWHQDASYWPLTPARTVTVWLAIDDADKENAAMQFIPKTHDKGHLKWKKTEKDAVLQQEIEGVEALGDAVWDEMPAGWISLHADMLVHGSQPNTSDRRRCGLTIRYCPPEVRPVNKDWAQQAIIARGEDPSGHWIHNPRPAGNTLDPGKKPKAYGTN